MNSWIEQLRPLMEEYAGGDLEEEGLSGDDIEDLCNLIKIKIRVDQGNMTHKEYELALDTPHYESLNEKESESGDNYER